MKRFIGTLLLLLVFTATACSSPVTVTPDSITAEPILIPTQESILNVELTPTQIPNRVLPMTEAEIPRVTVQDAKAALDNGSAIIIDVRSQAAYDAEHIAGARFFSLSDMETKPAELGLDKNQWIITYCTWQNEHTSARAALSLLQHGFKQVTPILGGLQAWIDAGYPVESTP